MINDEELMEINKALESVNEIKPKFTASRIGDGVVITSVLDGPLTISLESSPIPVYILLNESGDVLKRSCSLKRIIVEACEISYNDWLYSRLIDN